MAFLKFVDEVNNNFLTGEPRFTELFLTKATKLINPAYLVAQQPVTQLAAPVSTAHFGFNGVMKAKTYAAAAKAAAANAFFAAEAANRAACETAAKACILSYIAEAKDASLQRDLDDIHIAHARIARQSTYPCLGF